MQISLSLVVRTESLEAISLAFANARALCLDGLMSSSHGVSNEFSLQSIDTRNGQHPWLFPKRQETGLTNWDGELLRLYWMVLSRKRGTRSSLAAQWVVDMTLSLLWLKSQGLGTSSCCGHGQKRKKEKEILVCELLKYFSIKFCDTNLNAP